MSCRWFYLVCDGRESTLTPCILRGWVTGFASITVWGMWWRSPIGVGDDGEWRSGTTGVWWDAVFVGDDGVEMPAPVRLLPPRGPF